MNRVRHVDDGIPYVWKLTNPATTSGTISPISPMQGPDKMLVKFKPWYQPKCAQQNHV